MAFPLVAPVDGLAESVAMSDTAAPALKNIFDPARLRHIAAETAAVYPRLDSKQFLKLALKDLDDLPNLAELINVDQSELEQA